METATDVRKARPRIFTDEERRAALELAATIGVSAASVELDVHRRVIYKWAERNPKLWSDLRAGNQEAQTHGFATRVEDLANEYTAAEMTAVAQAHEQIESGQLDAKELAALIKAMGSSRGIAAGNARQARGEVERVEHNINFPAIEAAMERLLGMAPAPLPAIEGTVADDS